MLLPWIIEVNIERIIENCLCFVTSSCLLVSQKLRVRARQRWEDYEMLLIWEHALSYILSQPHHTHMTQSLLLEQLHEWESDISVGSINALLTLGKGASWGEGKTVVGCP
jgi:hypothetical protein